MARRRKKVELPAGARGVLATNIGTIMDKVPALRSQPKVAEKGKLGQSSVGRVLRGEVNVKLDSIEAIGRAASLEAWQMLVPGLDPLKPPKLGGGDLAQDERELLQLYRGATGRWKIAIKYMAKLRADERQEEAVSYVLSLVSATPVSDDKLGEGWTRPDRRQAPALHEPEPDVHEPGAYRRRKADRKAPPKDG